MRRGRTLILFGLLLALAAVVLFWLLSRSSAPSPSKQPTAQPVAVTKIVVAVQPIPRGGQVITGAVDLRDWPTSLLPPGALNELGRATGRYAKMDIPQGVPVLPSMLAASPAEAAAAGGSMAALAIQTGKVGVAFPLKSVYPEKESLPYDRRSPDVSSRLLSVAYAIQPGDRVDLLACFWVYELDKDFQSFKPNQLMLIDTETRKPSGTIQAGRPAVAPGGLPAVEYASSNSQLPRMVCQWMVQNVRVLGLGDWGVAPAPVSTPAGGGPTPTPAPVVPQVITLEVDPQDALVLKYARETGAQMDMVLRAPNDKESRFNTEAVTLQYMFERFRVSIPAKLDYTISGGAPPVIKPQQP
jgi:Flp pilus assembly protein CpaB